MKIDLKKAKVAQLDEIIALFKETGAEVPEFKNGKEKLAWLEPKIAEAGLPEKVTEENIEEIKAVDADKYADINVGDIIFVIETEEKPPVENSDEDEEDEEDTEAFPFKFYRGEPVIEIRNVMLNGRLYVDVFTPGASYRITTDEFEQLKKNNG